jgi:hypothetical protein
MTMIEQEVFTEVSCAKSKEKSSSLEDNKRSDSQETPCPL